MAGARGYRAPDTSELYRLQRQQSIADLDSERLDSIEVGTRCVRRSAIARRVHDEEGQRDLPRSGGFKSATGRRVTKASSTKRPAPIETLSLALAGTMRSTRMRSIAVDGGETIVSGRDVDTAPRHVNTARLEWHFLQLRMPSWSGCR